MQMSLRRMKKFGFHAIVYLTGVALILTMMLSLANDSSAANLAKSCSEVRQQDPSASDGEYILDLQGKTASIYCADMSGTPTEYITLALTGPDVNYSFFPGSHVDHRYRWYLITGVNAHTSYLKIRIDPVSLVVDQTDVTFTNKISVGVNGYDWSNPSFNPTPKTANYATASDCYNMYSNRGKANVNLSGTDFAIDDSVVFSTQGWAQNGSFTMNEERQVVDMTGGGWCGGTGPEGPLKLKVNSAADHVAPVTTDNAFAGWINTDVTVTLSASDTGGSGLEATYYTVNGGAEQTGNTVEFTAEGTHTLTYWSVDKAGNTEEAKSVAIQIDKTAPTVNVGLDKTTLGAPNHKLVEVTALIEAADSLSGLESIVLTSIHSNEPDFDPHTVDDDVANDIQEATWGENDTSFMLRAERSGEGVGRTYTITYTGTDKAGNQTTATAIVEVSHNQGKNMDVPKGKKK
jgi:hypothetical protein